jgi:hypothetical protein
MGRAVHAYLQGLRPGAAARSLQCGRATWWRWRRRKDFLLEVLIEQQRRRALAA